MGDAVHPSVFVVGAALAAVVLGPCRAQLASTPERAVPITIGQPSPDDARTKLTSLFADGPPPRPLQRWPNEPAVHALAHATASDVIDGADHGPGVAATPEPVWPRLSAERLGGGRRGIEVVVAVERAAFGPGDSLEVRSLRRSRALRALPILRDAVGLYPDGVLEKAGIRRIVMVGGLERSGKKIGGTAITSTGTLIVKPELLRLATEVVVHHEIGHFLDHATSDGPDPEWTALNASGFEYGEVQVAKTMERDTRTPGFLSAYGRTSPREDKAELYRWLVTQPTVVADAAPADPYIDAKMELLGARLATLDARLDTDWWRGVWAQQSLDRADELKPRPRRRR